MIDTDQRPRRRQKMKLPDGVDLARLCEAINEDRRNLEPFRQNRRDAVLQLVGKHYSFGGAPVEVPVNLLGMYQDIITESLVPSNLRIMLSTFEKEQEAVVDAMQAWVNDEIVTLNASETYKRCIIDALYCMGIMEVGLADPVDAVLSGWDEQAGQPFMDSIDLDDWFGDFSARTFDRMAYAGHRYRVPVALANELYLKGKSDKLEASDDESYNYGGDERIDTIGRDRRREEAEDHCDLWQIYLARHKLILTLRDDGGVPSQTKDPIRIQKWIGPYCGPYHYLPLGIVPGNLMPKAPAMDLIDLHRHYNKAYRKLLRQTGDYKKNQAYRGGAADEGKRFKDAMDGEMVQSDNPESIVTVESGGPANQVLVMSDHIKQMFDFVGGNLALLGGRGAQSRTATQDKILNENAGSSVAKMQDATLAFIQKTMESMNWYYWYHPTKQMKSKLSPPSAPELSITRVVNPVHRRGTMPTVKVDPYSLPRQTPQSRLAFINQTLQTMAPMMALLQQQGIVPNMEVLLKLFAKYGDEPDLTKIFQIGTVPAPDRGPSAGGGGPGMPATTTRNYNRTSTAGGPQEQAADLTKNINRMQGPVNPNQGQ